MRKTILIGLTLLIASCGEAEETGGLTADESRQLNEAAAMLDTMPDESIVEETPVPENAAAQ